MKVLVTGGAGYVGTRLTEALLSRGHRVTVLDNFARGYDSLMHLASDRNLHVVDCDVLDVSWRELRGIEAVYHLAALSGYTACEAAPDRALAVNVGGTEALLDALPDATLLIYASTTSIFGPPTLYARTKLQAERLVMQRANSIAIRWATLFGVSPAMRHDLLPQAFARQAVQDGRISLFSPEQRRTFMHVADAADAYVQCLDRPERLVGRVWNVGDTGLTCSKRELAEAIAECCPCEIVTQEQPDADARDLAIGFAGAECEGLTRHTTWAQHVPELVRLYAWHPGVSA